MRDIARIRLSLRSSRPPRWSASAFPAPPSIVSSRRLRAAMSRICRVAPLFLLALGILLTIESKSSAQKKAPTSGNPQAPRLALTAPQGMQRGTALELTLAGVNLARPTGLWTSIPAAKVSIPADADNGKDAAKLRVRLEVPKDTPLGYYGIRLATVQGVSNLRLF